MPLRRPLSLLFLLVPGLAWATEHQIPLAHLTSWFNDTPFSPLLFLLAYLLAQQLFISSTLFNLVGGALFGPLLGTLLNLLGATAGATLSFYTSRHLLASRLAPYLPHSLRLLLREVEQEGWRGVTFVRLLPGLPYALLNYTLGLTRLSLAAFLVPTLLCVGPRIALYTYLGHTGRAAVEGKAGMVSHLMVALGLLVAVTWLPHLWRRVRPKSSPLNRGPASAPSDSRDNPDGSPHR